MQRKASRTPFLLLSYLGLLTATSAQTFQQCTNAVSLSPAISEYNATAFSILTLYCVASNPAVVDSYIWQKNGNDLSYPANKYIIGGLGAGDGGVYQCGVQFCGSMQIYSTAITVNTAPSITESSTGIILLNEGQSFRLLCVAEGWPTPIISWTLGAGGLVLPTAYGSSTYLVQSAAIGDSGTYTCTAANILGSVTAVVDVTVLALAPTPLASSALLKPSPSGGPAVVATSGIVQPLPTTTSTIGTSSLSSTAVPSSLIRASISTKPAITTSLLNPPYSSPDMVGSSTSVPTLSSQLFTQAPSAISSASSSSSSSTISSSSSASILSLPTTSSVNLLGSLSDITAIPVSHSSAPVVATNPEAGVPFAGVSFMLAVAAALFGAFLISTVVAFSACVYYRRKTLQQRKNRAAEADKTKLVADMEGGTLHRDATDGGLSPTDDEMPTTFGDFSSEKGQLKKDKDQEHKDSDTEELHTGSADEVQLIGSSAKATRNQKGTKMAEQKDSEKEGPSEVRKPRGPSEVHKKPTGPSEVRRTGPSEVHKSSKSAEQKGPSEVRRTGPSEVRRTGPSEVRRTGPSEVRRTGPSEVRRTGPSEVRRTTGPSEVRRTTGPSEVRRTTGPSEVRKTSKTEEGKAGPSNIQKPTEQRGQKKVEPAVVQKSSASAEKREREAIGRKSSVSAEDKGKDKADAPGVQKSSMSVERRESERSGAPGPRRSTGGQQASTEKRPAVSTRKSVSEETDASELQAPARPTAIQSSIEAEQHVVEVVDTLIGSNDEQPLVANGDDKALPATIEAKETASRSKKLKLNIADHDRLALIGANEEESGEDAGEVENQDLSTMSVFVEKAKKMGRSVAYVQKMSRSHPLTAADIDDLLQKANEAIGNNKESENPIVSEFNSIPVNSFPDQQLAPSVTSKNRYSNILPNPYSAVKLLSNGQEGSTYINANYVHGSNGNPEKAFIMTQGPIPETFADFWRMVWENNVPSIVMLTRLVENSKEKCSRYWPEASNAEPVVYGQYSIRNNFEQVEASYTISYLTISLEQNGISQDRDVVHLWYTAWPDFGVPSECSTILDFYNTANAYINPASGPTVVHCSAGVGRSGAFIAIQMGISEFKETKTVDPLKYLCSIRQDRGGAIQTWEQYLYVHRVLAEYMVFAAAGSS